MFGEDSVADTECELPFIRRVPDEDGTLLQPTSRKDRDSFCPGLTPSLRDACDYFVLALAARRARGQEGCHCCMLIHTTIYAACHRRICRMVETEWLAPLISELRAGDEARTEALRTLWERECRAVDTAMRADLSCPPEPESFDDLRFHLLPAAESISMTVENSEAELSQRLDFTRADPVHSIVIGGNVLARGLTIEGLACSFFIRSSNQYDTLMQMGRWFGYRRGYEDLPRIWMTRELENAFRDLVNVEEMIRSEIIEITRMGWTPSEMAVRVPQIASLSITARNKLVLENLEECEVSFYGTHQQTISFPINNEYHHANWAAGYELVQSALSSSDCCRETKGSSYLVRDVGYSHVLRFLRSYKFEKDSMQGMTEFIEREIDNGEDSMEIWNVGIIGARGGRTVSLGGIHDLTLVTRTKINPRAFSRSGGSIERELNTQIYIKALMGVGDTLLDVDRTSYTKWLANLVDPGFDQARESWLSVKRYRNHAMGGRPLLLLYPIDRLSEPRGWDPARPVEEHERLPLLYGLGDAAQLAFNILGIGIVFPQSTRATARHCVRVKLSRAAEGETFDDAEIESIERLME
ncbi:MAG: Z1 domain-containing protein, partial [Synechococcus sp.]|nr:Z1 domain-containing protein [Synechococcus sp.]